MNARNVNLATDLLTSAPNSSSSSKKNSAAGINSEYAKLLRKTIAQNNNPTQITTVKRFKPDGSILITTYEDGQISAQTKIKPHLVPVPDFSAPKTPEGETPVKWEPRLNLFDLLRI